MARSSIDPKLEPFTGDQLINLLNIYATQVGSYTTLLWQVPALSLTAQSFLLTIALTNSNGKTAKVVAAGLSVVISLASYALMHDQRGHAINYGELAKRLSSRLELGRLINTDLKVKDGVPKGTDADHLWTWRDEGGRRLEKQVTPRAGRMYAVWKGCMILFFLTDVGIIFSVFTPLRVAILIPATVGVLGLLCVMLSVIWGLLPKALRKQLTELAGRAWRKVTRGENKLTALTRRMEELDAPDPSGRAASEIRENIAEQARLLALRRIWAQALTPWRDVGTMYRDPALRLLLAQETDPDLLAIAVRRVVYKTVSAVVDVIDEGKDPDAPANAPGWALIEARADRIKITGRAVGNLREDLREVDPQRAEAAEFR
jgi:hypothetical protein